MQGRRADPSRSGPRTLPVIAPRGEGIPSIGSLGALVGSNVPAEFQGSQRSRLPPRSRSGCWTCRQRKVKCDEQRPTCGQCARLNHTCDYNPRFLFKDDTSRVIDRLSEVRSEDSSVWDPNAPEPDFELDTTTEDSLPSFSSLTTDEERERKAELTPKKGTYLVVVNPGSFENLPEYSDEALFGASSTFPGRLDAFDTASSSRNTLVSDDDPDVVILKKFEDSNRKSSISSPIMIPGVESPVIGFQPHSQGSFEFQPAIQESQGVYPRASSQPDIAMSLLDQARRGGPDAPLLQHYRTYISPNVIKLGHQDIPEDIFEIEARTYRPLYHAMMAISALSLAHRSGISSTDAMLHYGKVISALREASEQSSTSDGAIFTHYLLLLYEIFHAGSKDSAMWNYHCDAILRVIAERNRLYNFIPHGFIVWMTSLVDLYALLSGSGPGSFIRSLAAQNLTLSPDMCLPPLGPHDPQRYFPNEASHLPHILALSQKVVHLAVQIGHTARDLRAEQARRLSAGSNALGPVHIYEDRRRDRVRAIQELCRSCSQDWSTSYASYWPGVDVGHSLPIRVLRALNHAHNLYRACVIYAHTSMYPGQMMEMTPEFQNEVPACVEGILQTAADMINRNLWELNCLTFTLFIAGYAALDNRQKSRAIQLLQQLEPHSMGANTTMTRQLLQHIYAKQHANMNTIGYDFSIDWKTELDLTGRGLIMFGL